MLDQLAGLFVVKGEHWLRLCSYGCGRNVGPTGSTVLCKRRTLAPPLLARDILVAGLNYSLLSASDIMIP
jgi:hypothetical protein